MSAHPFLPEPFYTRFLAMLKNQTELVYAQVATIDAKGNPRVRTVRLLHEPVLDSFIFNTHTHSAKWTELRMRAAMSGCYFHAPTQTQYRWEGRGQLIGIEDSGGPEILPPLWEALRPDIRKGHWLKELHGKPGNIDKLCPTFGTVVCHAERWDIYEMCDPDYTKHRRTIYTLDRLGWKSKHVSTFDEATGEI